MHKGHLRNDLNNNFFKSNLTKTFYNLIFFESLTGSSFNLPLSNSQFYPSFNMSDIPSHLTVFKMRSYKERVKCNMMNTSRSIFLMAQNEYIKKLRIKF